MYCEKVDFLVSEVILFYRLCFFFFSHLYPMAHPQLCLPEFFFLLFFLLTPRPPCLFYRFFPSNAKFLHLFPCFSFSLSTHTSHTLFSLFFFSHACVSPTHLFRQSCARCHVAATAFARRASASARRAGSALRATRERAIPAVKNTASATTGPASASPAGRGSTVTSVSRLHVGVINYSL